MKAFLLLLLTCLSVSAETIWIINTNGGNAELRFVIKDGDGNINSNLVLVVPGGAVAGNSFSLGSGNNIPTESEVTIVGHNNYNNTLISSAVGTRVIVTNGGYVGMGVALLVDGSNCGGVGAYSDMIACDNSYMWGQWLNISNCQNAHVFGRGAQIFNQTNCTMLVHDDAKFWLKPDRSYVNVPFSAPSVKAKVFIARHATNAPANTSVPEFWAAAEIEGDTNQYRIPLFK